MKIAVCGKGGVGKSTIAALLCGALLEKGYKVLAIDADPSPHLARLLGFKEADKVTPIAEMKDLLTARAEKDGPFYSLNPKVDDLPEKFTLVKNGLKLMVLGAVKEAGGGCACPEQTVLRRLLSFLLLQSKEAIVIDLEAGVEPFGRATISAIDAVLIVVQPYRGSIETAKQIAKMAKDLGVKKIFFVANNIEDKEDLIFLEKELGAQVLVHFPASQELARAERKGQSILDIEPPKKVAIKLVERLENHLK
ncbi:ATP-binding protein [Thermodesulfatator autotrophicus]|uniref:Carbon monoxide dehydrogenase n=1 Tax=Thermodesulfatator autotrophicus TaxID=1795632 RepID=A0A177E8G0_9BACT|nr:AAA family ATPase [Thermodesulfatator autotrophicus]OAG28247.1 carbon monoxide dehydrogenase [Thermodesulfatator autotrophicus]